MEDDDSDVPEENEENGHLTIGIDVGQGPENFDEFVLHIPENLRIWVDWDEEVQ
jgi:hypothetical protein